MVQAGGGYGAVQEINVELDDEASMKTQILGELWTSCSVKHEFILHQVRLRMIQTFS